MAKMRLDILLVKRRLAESRNLANRLVMAGQVRVDGQMVLKPGTGVSTEARVEIIPGPRYVSRGGDKLEAALRSFSMDVTGLICADVGASTGGFTDCLLQHGAERVYAIDVGQGILDWSLRKDPRVFVMEGVNARFLSELAEPVSLVTVDVSFISLKVILPVLRRWFIPSPNSAPDPQAELPETIGEAIALVKPQFEAGKSIVGRGKGVIRDPAVRQQVLLDVLNFAQVSGYGVRGLIRSPLVGPKGNVEFLAWLSYPGSPYDKLELLVTQIAGEDRIA